MIWLNPTAALALFALAAPIVIHVLVHRNAPRVAFPTLRFIQPARLASIRRRALERLYERRETVRTLIAALEGYQSSREARLAECITLTPSTSRSSFSRSRI